MTDKETLQKNMGYTETVKNCANCQFGEEREVWERMWERFCTLNPAMTFQVKDHATCTFHKPKEKQ
jgi:hypothetical protein